MEKDQKEYPLRNKKLDRIPLALYNIVSIVGGLFALLGVLGVIFIFFQSFFSGNEFAYQGVAVALLMLVIIIGLILVVIGIFRERRNRRAGHAPSFSEQSAIRHPLLAMISGFVLVTATALVMLTGSYQVYQATESVEFCGLLCHSVMRPEWVTYHDSPHARVACVECHIGEGADWFVRSKLSGIRQVYGVLFNDYSKPIPTPIENLRPARETCEQCHWPNRFVGFKEKVYTYYLADEENTAHKIRMLIKIGGEEEAATQKGSGIHYYMLSNKIEYIAEDHDRQHIGYVRMTLPDDSVVEYTREGFDIEDPENQGIRVLDCLDCHNRPSHRFRPPMDIVNDDIRKGLIPHSLPYIKEQAVLALDSEYDTTEQAVTGIQKTLEDFYAKEYPNIADEQPQDLEHAVRGVQGVYQKSIFPEMKASWKVYPNNLGHRFWPGCFRCHNEEMVNEQGESLYKGCNSCHIILAQGENITEVDVNFNIGLPFFHPGNDETIDFFFPCTDCHGGGAGLY